MPKIALRYTGDDKAVVRRLAATDGVQYFEPVDAREVLATPDAPYEVDEDSRKLIGARFDPSALKINIPQLQGEDSELQTGLSHEKYGRSQVVKAIPGAMMPQPGVPQSTTGRPLDMSQVGEGGGARAARMPSGAPDGDGDNVPLSEGMTRDEIKAALKERNVSFDNNAHKDELASLLDRQPR